MGFNEKKGITVASGFKLQAAALLDARGQVKTIAERDELVTLNAVTAGLRVYVEETKTSYVYNGSGWDELSKGAGYTHPDTPGNKHIPAGGASGQVLGWSADGQATWVEDKDTTYSPATADADGLMRAADKAKLDGIATGANNYTHPDTPGNKHIPAGGAAGQVLGWSADGQAKWVADKDTTYSPATADADGLMRATDKAKLDGVDAGANKYIHPEQHPATMIAEDDSHQFVTKAQKEAIDNMPSIGFGTEYPQEAAPNSLFFLIG